MLTVQKVALERAIVLLDSLGAEYVVQIQGEEPVIKGNLLVAPKKKEKAKRMYEYGTFTTIFRDMGIDKMAIGDVRTVPVNDFPFAKMQSALSSFCTNTWGAASVITSLNKSNKSVEVIRLL